MAEQLVINRYNEEEQPGLNWPRIIGIAFVIALHVAAFLLLLIPAVAPPGAAEEEMKTMVTIVAVSYTHLDVYKRQSLTVSLLAEFCCCFRWYLARYG